MRHFDHLDEIVRKQLFHTQPGDFDLDSEIPVLAHALGATLYMPGTRPNLTAAIQRRAAAGVRSMVIDLEDAVEDSRVGEALDCAVDCVTELSETGVDAMIFIRVRTPEHIDELSTKLPADAHALYGFVLPKFSPWTGQGFLDAAMDFDAAHDVRTLVMPVIETPEAIYRESRDGTLSGIRELLNRYRDNVLAVRFGATDLCGLFGIRRERDLTIYDVRVVADLISDTVNHLGRSGDDSSFVITAPVWEYFANHERLFRPQLRNTPFMEHDALSLRHRLITKDFDDLIRESVLDRANGLHGKTVIHPSHVPPVHALSVVSFEEYSDARGILESKTGAQASAYRDKMNEAGPHRHWAEQIMLRARVFGVASEETSFVDLLAALVSP